MKKLIAALMMAVMLVGTALAVDSPVADTGVEVLEGGIIITTNNSQEAADTVNAAAIKFVGEDEQVILVDAYLWGNATLPITVKLKIAAAAGKKVTTLHYGKDGWEEVSATSPATVVRLITKLTAVQAARQLLTRLASLQ